MDAATLRALQALAQKQDKIARVLGQGTPQQQQQQQQDDQGFQYNTVMNPPA
jgi:hypothetical protein